MTAPNPLAQFVVPATTEQYRMGPLFTEAPEVDFWWNQQHADGTFAAAERPTGWDAVTYVTPVDQVGGRDGGLFGPGSIAPRMLDVSGMVSAVSPMALDQKLQRLERILGPQSQRGARQPVIWEQYQHAYGQRVAMITRPVGDFVPVIAWGGTVATVRFTLIAANPVWKYRAGVAETNQVGLANPALITGRTYDKTYNFTYGLSPVNPGGEMTVVNSGNLDAYPVFTITGPGQVPIITNATTGASFVVNRNLVAGEVVTIDSRTGAVNPSSVRLLGRPFVLVPGTNTIRWRMFTGAYSSDALLRLDWRSTYR